MTTWASLPQEIKLKIMEYENQKHENYKIFLAEFKSIYTKCGYERCSNYIKRDHPSTVKAKSEKRGPFDIYFCCYKCSIEERVNRIQYQNSEPTVTSDIYYYDLMTP